MKSEMHTNWAQLLSSGFFIPRTLFFHTILNSKMKWENISKIRHNNFRSAYRSTTFNSDKLMTNALIIFYSATFCLLSRIGCYNTISCILNNIGICFELKFRTRCQMLTCVTLESQRECHNIWLFASSLSIFME